MDSARPPLAEAERRRGAGDWRGAAAAYAAHLAVRPNDWAIWVQHGHCVKEAGDPAAALAAYRRAEAGLPEDADLQLQIGHALKMTGDLAAARAAYARALDLDPASETAWQEVSALLGAAAAADMAGGLALLDDLDLVFDLSDLLSWFGTHRAPSGIQRLQMEIGRALLSGGAGARVRLAAFAPAPGAWREVPREAFSRLYGLSRRDADPLEAAWTATRAQLEAILAAAPDLPFAPGAWLVNLGTSWWLPGYHQAVRAARARSGVRYAALVHDVGPILLPEYSEPAVSARFARWFATLGVEADLLLAVSEATRGDMLRVAAQALSGLPFAPVRVLRPDAALPPAPPGRPHPRVAELRDRPFVLSVGTIESRKDHLFVLNGWLALLRRHGDAVPPLVLVGRAGFEAAPVLALLQRAPALEGRVVWLDDVADGALAELYRHALFTICHSRHEGWGLPVTEALAAGKVVLAPGHSGLLESGQGLALHYAPGSEPEFLALAERLLFEAGYRPAQEARVAAGLGLRSWQAIAGELTALLAAAPPAPGSPPAPPLGTVLALGEIPGTHPSPAMAWAERLRAGAGWHPPEPWGCWTRPGRALLTIPLPADAARPLRLQIALRGAAAGREVTLRPGRGARRAVRVEAEARPVVALELHEPGPSLDLVIEAASIGETDDAAIGIGVVAVMACAADDVAARLGFLEHLAFVWPEPPWPR